MSKREIASRRMMSVFLGGALAVTAALGVSCERTRDGANMKLGESIYGLYLGETKAEIFKRARGVATITTVRDLPRDLVDRGELYVLSAPLEPYQGIDHIRLAFLNDKLWEIIVYYKDVTASNLEWLRLKLEGQYQTKAVAPDGTIEQAYKTYRLAGPGLSITLRRITKKTSTELYVQYIHDELRKQLPGEESRPR